VLKKRYGVIIPILSFIFFILSHSHISCVREKNDIHHQKNEEPGYSNIKASELLEKIANGEYFILLDVRKPEEYNEGHIEGAMLIPYKEINTQYRKLGCKCEEIVVYCKSGKRSAIASKSLVKLGFHNVENLVGGIEAWKEMGGPVIKKEN
jgi:phage shock protein E